jgi:HPt (histidine-containing phosphotransfer) domain-containing protein
MTPQVDIARFQSTTGGLVLLGKVAAAFLRQLEPWRQAFAAKSAAGETRAMAELLHKMKGSCYAISAHEAAAQFAAAEHALQEGNAAAWAEQRTAVLDVLRQIEQELIALSPPPPKAP